MNKLTKILILGLFLISGIILGEFMWKNRQDNKTYQKLKKYIQEEYFNNGLD